MTPMQPRARPKAVLTTLLALIGGWAIPTCAATSEESPQPSLSVNQLCTGWDSPVEVGRLDPQLIDESSGLEGSAAFPERLYHVNDSGDPGRFFVTSPDGNNRQVVVVDGFDPFDVEDLAFGSCGAGGGQCLFIADIGDNSRRRAEIEVVSVRETDRLEDSVDPLHRIGIRYPEGSQDAESLAYHPTGDLFIVTKSADYDTLEVFPSRLYRLPAQQWSVAGNTLTPQLVGEWDLSRISSDPFSGSLPTAADISDDGERLLLLTYTNAFEFAIESWESLKPTSEMQEGVDYVEIDLETLEQQESVAYMPGSRSFRYTTESVGGSVPRIMEVRCLR